MLTFTQETCASLSKLSRTQMVALIKKLWSKGHLDDVSFLLDYNFARFDKVITEQDIDPK